MRTASLFLALCTLSGCLLSHSIDAVPTAYDDVPVPHMDPTQVRTCTFEMLYFLPATSNLRRPLRSASIDRLQQQGAFAHVTVETISRSWLIGRNDCTVASGHMVPPGLMRSPKR